MDDTAAGAAVDRSRQHRMQLAPTAAVIDTELDETVHHLVGHFPEVSADVVSRTVEDAVDNMQPVRVATFVPVLAEHAAASALEAVAGRRGSHSPESSGSAGQATIVVGFDGSLPSQAALEWAVEEARLWHARCTVVEAWRAGWSGWHRRPVTWAAREGQLETAVRDVCTVAALEPPEVVELHLGDPERVLAQAGQDADLLVVGSRGHSALEDLFLGSVSTAVLDQRQCPIVVVPPAAEVHTRHQRIVVGVDGSAAAFRALRWAAEEAGRRGGELLVVHAWQVPAMVITPFVPTVPVDAQELRSAAQDTLDQAVRHVDPGAVVARLVEGQAAEALRSAAEAADLLVVGSCSYGKVAATILGSTTRACVHRAPCPVAVIP